jgi:hypothetical protein
MVICGCGLPACCCQPAVAGSIIYADLWDELNTHLALQALFPQSSPVCEPLLQAFPFPRTVGEVTLHLFLRPACLFTVHLGSGSSSLSCGVFLPLPLLQGFPLLIAGYVLLLLLASMFVYSSCGRWVLPPLLWSFPPFSTLTSFPTPGCWACAPAPAGASPARPGLFIYSLGKIPLLSFSPQGAPSSLLLVFIVLIAYYSVSLFSTGGGQSVQGALLIWPSVVCQSTVYCLAHLVRVFPSHPSTGDWWPGGPPGFSV